jgi:hypothetical protein
MPRRTRTQKSCPCSNRYKVEKGWKFSPAGRTVMVMVTILCALVSIFETGLTYISAMPKRSPRSKLFEWRVIQLKATPTRLIGYFDPGSEYRHL